MDTDFIRKEFFLQPSGTAGSLNALSLKAINVILIIAGALAVIYFIYSGILFLTAAGNPDAVKKGQQGLIYGAIGIVVIVISNYILTAIADFVRIK